MMVMSMNINESFSPISHALSKNFKPLDKFAASPNKSHVRHTRKNSLINNKGDYANVGPK